MEARESFLTMAIPKLSPMMKKPRKSAVEKREIKGQVKKRT